VCRSAVRGANEIGCDPGRPGRGKPLTDIKADDVLMVGGLECIEALGWQYEAVMLEARIQFGHSVNNPLKTNDCGLH